MLRWSSTPLRSNLEFRMHLGTGEVASEPEKSALSKLMCEFDAALTMTTAGFSAEIYKLGFKFV